MCAPPNNWCTPWRGRESAWSTSVRWPPSGPPRPECRLAEDAEPHPLTHYGKSKLDAEQVVRDLAPDAVIVRPPVVYGPRDTDVFQLLKSISKGLVLEIAGGERWFSAIYVKDLVDGLLAAARHAARRRPDLFPGACQARVLAPTGGLCRAHHGAHAARRDRARSPRPTRSAPAPKSGRASPQAGHHLAREDRRSALHVLDLRYRARRRWNSASWRPRPSTKASPQPWRGTRRPVG